MNASPDANPDAGSDAGPAGNRVAVARVRGTAGRTVVLALQLLLLVVIAGGWEVAARTGYADEFFFSKPSDIAVRIVTWVVSGTIWRHLAATLAEALLAFLLGATAGILAGVVLARIDLLAAVLDPYIRILNALPRVILAPIFILWFGLGMASKVALGTSLVFFVVFFNTFQGMRGVDTVVLNNARMLRASDLQLLRYVYLPSTVSWIFSSLHTSIGFALVGAVVGEYMGASEGMGYLVAQAQGVLDTTGVMAGLLLTSAVVLVIDMVIHRLERHLLRWQPSR